MFGDRVGGPFFVVAFCGVLLRSVVLCRVSGLLEAVVSCSVCSVDPHPRAARAGDGVGDWLTVDEVADRAHVCRETVRRWCRLGIVPSLRIGRRLLIRGDVLHFAGGDPPPAGAIKAELPVQVFGEYRLIG